jgi:hypothetical protein
MRPRNQDFPRQDKDFYSTPDWMTVALLGVDEIHLPNGILEPCCGDGAISRVLESRGHSVVSTDLVYRGYGEGGRDFMLEDRMPDGKTAIVTNPPYGRGLRKFVEHALELLLPVGGTLVLLMNSQWMYSLKNSKLVRHPAFDFQVVLTDRPDWFRGPDGRRAPKPDGSPGTRGSENYCWLVWNWSRQPGPWRGLVADNPEKHKESEPEIRSCSVCRAPLPVMARADARLCSATCRQRASRRGMAQRRTA